MPKPGRKTWTMHTPLRLPDGRCPDALWRGCLVLLLALAISASGAPAQVVTGTFSEQGSAEPVAGAVVVLLDETGAVLRSTLTDPAGSFYLQAAGPGGFRLRGERIGYASAYSPILAIAGGETREYHLVAPATAIKFEGITANASRRDRGCQVRPREGLQISTLWEEARKALHAASVANRQEALQFRVALYERTLNARSLTIEEETRRTRSGFAAHPFATRLSTGQLSAGGYVQALGDDIIFHAPDADVLLSEQFLDDHCLSVRDPAPGDEGDRIGVAFQPLDSRRVTDVQGVLWLNRMTAELEALEFQYTRLPWSIPAEKLGGRVEFERLPNGMWIVRRWWIRMPQVRVTAREESRLPGGKLGYRQESLTGIKEEGGEVTDVTSRRDRLYATAGATLSGLVWDSTRAAPLAGAAVYLSGTQHTANSDERGRFTLRDLPAGSYTLGFMHPRLAELNVLPAPRQVSIAAATSGDVLLAIPAIGELAAAEPPAGAAQEPGGERSKAGSVRVVSREAGAGAGCVTGQIVDPDGNPLHGARVRLAGKTAGSVADAAGTFRIENLAPGTHIVEVQRIGFSPETLRVQLGEGETVRVAVALAVEPVELDGVLALGEGLPARSHQVDGFYERRERGLGRYLVREELDRFGSSRLSDALRSVPWLHFFCNGLRCVVRIGNGQRLSAPSFRADAGGGNSVIRGPAATGSSGGAAGPPPADASPSVGDWKENAEKTSGVTLDCPVQYFVNGSPFSQDFMDLDHFRAHEVEGIEIYRPGLVPVQFTRGKNAGCGVIVIWTR